MQMSLAQLTAAVRTLQRRSSSSNWAKLPLSGYWANSGHGVNGFWYMLGANGDGEYCWDITLANANPGSPATQLPAGIYPVNGCSMNTGWTGTGPASYNNQFCPFINVSASGLLTVSQLFTANLRLFGSYRFNPGMS